MTPDLIKLSHTPEGQNRLRVMLAELVGLKPTTFRGQIVDAETLCDTIPDFTRDLNAVHEVEKQIPRGQWTRYEDHLTAIGKAELLKSGVPAYDAARICTISATAAQRTVALILILTPNAEEDELYPSSRHKGELEQEKKFRAGIQKQLNELP